MAIKESEFGKNLMGQAAARSAADQESVDPESETGELGRMVRAKIGANAALRGPREAPRLDANSGFSTGPNAEFDEFPLLTENERKAP